MGNYSNFPRILIRRLMFYVVFLLESCDCWCMLVGSLKQLIFLACSLCDMKLFIASFIRIFP